MYTKSCNKFFATYGENFLRMMIGLIFIVAGFGKLFAAPGIAGFTTMLEGLGFPLAAFLAVVVGVVELLGGIFLFIGVWTRESATALAVVILVALFVMRLPNGFAASRLDLLLFAALTCYIGFVPKKSLARLVTGK